MQSSLLRRTAIGCAIALSTLALFGADSYPRMPEAVTSFGAVTHDEWLYVFGGHKGERHEYCAEMVSGAFHRLKLNGHSGWEEMPAAAPGQGLALVAHRGFVYRIGGMAARNRKGEESDLVSSALVQRYSPSTKRWEHIVSLPAPRSSHDAVVLGDTIFVVGGWALFGATSKPFWHTNALALNLAHLDFGWKNVPQPFQRRALAVAALEARLYCIGGMDSNNRTTLAVEIYDISKGQWTKGPDLPEGRNKGFGCSAISQGGRLYANTFQGDLLRLAADGGSWEAVGRLEHPRIAHRLVTTGDCQILALGGEDGEEKRPDLELLRPVEIRPPAEQSAAESGPTSTTHVQE